MDASDSWHPESKNNNRFVRMSLSRGCRPVMFFDDCVSICLWTQDDWTRDEEDGEDEGVTTGDGFDGWSV